MKTNITAYAITFLISLFLEGCDQSAETANTVSFSKDVMPVLQTHCLKCHNKDGDGYKASGLSMESYADLMAGTKFGPVIVAGNSPSSTLVRLINGKADPSITMPHGEMQLMKDQEIKAIVDWINQGAKNN